MLRHAHADHNGAGDWTRVDCSSAGSGSFRLECLPVNALHALRAEPAPVSHTQPALRDYVAKAVRRYLIDLGECDSHQLYDIVLREIEVPMLTEVMRHCDGNQSRAAATLGLNRATLRKKLREYGIS